MKKIVEMFGCLQIPSNVTPDNEMNHTVDLDGNEHTTNTGATLTTNEVLFLIAGRPVKVETGDIGDEANVVIVFDDGSQKDFGPNDNEQLTATLREIDWQTN